MKRRNGWAIEKEWICYAPGVVPALNFAVQAYSNPGDRGRHPDARVLSLQERPRSTTAANSLKTPSKLENGRYVMDYEGLERLIDAKTRMIVLCSPHNPVGRVWEKEKSWSASSKSAPGGGLSSSPTKSTPDLIIGAIRHSCTASLSRPRRRYHRHPHRAQQDLQHRRAHDGECHNPERGFATRFCRRGGRFGNRRIQYFRQRRPSRRPIRRVKTGSCNCSTICGGISSSSLISSPPGYPKSKVFPPRGDLSSLAQLPRPRHVGRRPEGIFLQRGGALAR